MSPKPLPNRPRREKFAYQSTRMKHRDADTNPLVKAWMRDLEGWGMQVADDIKRLEEKVFGKAQDEPGDPPPPPE